MKKLMILLCLLGLSIFCFVFLYNNRNSSKGNVSFTNDSITYINLSNFSPISDSLGKKISVDDNGFLSFSVFSSRKTNTKYEIYLKPVINSNTISLDYVKFYLTDGKTDNSLLNKVGVIGKLDNSSLNDNYKVLYTGVLRENEILSFNFRVWVADTYSVTNMDKNLEFVVGVRPLE